jgi:hypothetical protein
MAADKTAQKIAKKPAKSAKRQADGKFAKGVSGNPAGPKVGTKKAKTVLIEQKLEDLDFDPIRAMVELYREEDCPQAVKAKLDSEIAGYVFPKRKAVEHSGAIGGNRPLEEMTDQELEQIANGG